MLKSNNISSDLKKLASESLIYGLSTVITKFIGIFLVPLYTRIFNPEDYGIISLISTTMSVVFSFVVLALDSAASRWYWDTEEESDRKITLACWIWCQFSVSCIFAIFLFTLADPLGNWITGRNDIGFYIRLNAGILLLSTFSTVAINWLRMQRRPITTMMYTLLTNLVTLGLSVWLVLELKWGLKGVYIASTLGQLFSTFVAIGLLRNWLNPFYLRWLRLKEMLHYGLPLMPAALSFWIVNLSDRYFVQAYASTREVGLYHIGNSLAAMIALITTAFQLAWEPFAMSIYKQAESKTIFNIAFITYISITAVLSTALSVLTPELIRFFTTNEYAGASSVVSFLSFGYIMAGLYYIASTGATIMKKTQVIGIAILLAAVLNIILNFLLVPSLGKIGAAIATLISQTTVCIYLFYKSQILYYIPYDFKKATLILSFSGLTIYCARFLNFDFIWLSILLKLCLMSLFIGFLIIFKIINPAQIKNHLLSSAQNI